MHVDDFVGILGGYQAFREEHGTNITVKNMFGETVHFMSQKTEMWTMFQKMFPAE